MIIAEFEMSGCTAEEIGFVLRSSGDGVQQTLLLYHKQTGVLTFDRSRSDGWSEGAQNAILERTGGEPLMLHIFVDTSVVEVYADSYRTVMTNNIYPDPASIGLEIFVRGGSVSIISLDVWKLR
ncbi:hypothetical protein GCM10010912_50050 [Paenibacillus albidus]|uniref:Glycosyl hydrolase family 32 C-terminal domain-containing protein n=1 Tax=Paenibacillus albidus TaxID=2041023 RepID=A0A917CVR5_9BACL|nr:hypothetical protein GCM10010912_50050 [Paenibacillus albidus]